MLQVIIFFPSRYFCLFIILSSFVQFIIYISTNVSHLSLSFSLLTILSTAFLTNSSSFLWFSSFDPFHCFHFSFLLTFFVSSSFSLFNVRICVCSFSAKQRPVPLTTALGCNWLSFFLSLLPTYPLGPSDTLPLSSVCSSLGCLVWLSGHFISFLSLTSTYFQLLGLLQQLACFTLPVAAICEDSPSHYHIILLILLDTFLALFRLSMLPALCFAFMTSLVFVPKSRHWQHSWECFCTDLEVSP